MVRATDARPHDLLASFRGLACVAHALSAGFGIGAETWLLGVAHTGILLNDELGAIQPLGHGRHRLRIYAPYAEAFEANRFHVDVLFADGSVRSLTAPPLADNACNTAGELCHWAADCQRWWCERGSAHQFALLGRQRCDYTIDATVLGESSAPGCAKELTVEWGCSPNGSGPNAWRNLTVAAEPGDTVTISCEPL